MSIQIVLTSDEKEAKPGETYSLEQDTTYFNKFSAGNFHFVI